jgi:hypothetical protein
MNSGKSYKISCDKAEIKLAMVKGLEVNYIGSDGGYAAIEMANEKPKIKMTKTLPSDVGQYYYCLDRNFSVNIVDVEKGLNGLYCNNRAVINVARMDGYWAKVDESMFEFEGE